jgi:excisionase family DNA binding protein
LPETLLEEILTVPEIGRWLGLGDTSIRNRARSGALPARRVGAEWRFAREHVAARLGGAEASMPGAPAPGAFSDPDPFMTVQEVARWLRVGASTIYEELAAGRMPAYKERNQWRFSRTALLEWLLGDPTTEATRFRRPPRRRR